MAPSSAVLAVTALLALVASVEAVEVVPYVQAGARLLSPRGASDLFAASLAISGDGKTLAVGSTTGVGRTTIFKRVKGHWVRERPSLVGTGASPDAGQGFSVALSAAGDTLAVGAPADANGLGAVWVFIRSGTQWVQQGPKLVGDGVGPKSFSQQGFSIALSAEGDTLAVGGPGAKEQVGAVWVFRRDRAGRWQQQGPLLTRGSGFVRFGTSVALSGNGTTLAVGAEQYGAGVGATWVFVLSAGDWTQQGPHLVGTGGRGRAQQGTSVSLARDGDTLAVGGPYDMVHVEALTGEVLFDGAVWVFTRRDGQWSQAGGRILGKGDGRGTNFGYSVALSACGKHLVVGAPGLPSGRTFVFERGANDEWAQVGAPLVGRLTEGGSRQGDGVAVSATGCRVVTRTPNMPGKSVGAVWLFKRPCKSAGS